MNDIVYLVGSVLSVIKEIPLSFFAAIFAIYFSYMKITNKIAYSYSCSFGVYGNSLSSFVLRNRRDKTYVIKNIHCTLWDGEVINLKDFSPPLLLKPYEVVSVEFDKVSEWLDKRNDCYEPDFMKPFHIDVFIHGKGIIGCKREYVSDYLESTVHPVIYKFNNLLLNRSIRYVLYFFENGKGQEVSFYNGGYIDGDEHFGGYNHLGHDVPVTVEEIVKAIDKNDLDRSWSYYRIYEIKNLRPERVYQKLK